MKIKAAALKPVVRIGKSGLTENVLAEIKKQFKSHNLVKIKLLKACFEKTGKKEVAKNIADSTESVLILLQGNIVTIYKEKDK